MRAVPVFALCAMLVAIAAASIGVPNPPVPSAVPGPSAEPVPPAPSSGTDIMGLIRQLGNAVMNHDRAALDRLIDDNATIFDNGYACDQVVTKQQWIDSIVESQAASQIIDLLDHTVTAGFGVVHYQNALLLKESNMFANTSINLYHNILAAMPSSKGDKFIFIRNIIDGTYRQVNSSELMTGFYAWANATTSADVAALANILNGTATELVYPPHAKQPFASNRSAILADLAHAKETRAFLDVSYQFAIPACSSVAALVTTFDAQKDGRRFVNKAFVSVHFIPDGSKIYMAESFPIFWR